MKQESSCFFSWFFLLISLIFPGHANADLNGLIYPSGVILGVGAGATAMTYYSTFSANLNDVALAESNQTVRFGGMVNALIGYGKKLWDPFYFGAELGLNVMGIKQSSVLNQIQASTTVNDDSTFLPTTITKEVTFSAGQKLSFNRVIPYLDLKPGVLLAQNVLAFARIGLNYNHTKLSVKAPYTVAATLSRTSGSSVRTTEVAEGSLVYARSENRPGFRAGLGLEYLLTEHLGVTANYVYLVYHTQHLGGAGSGDSVSCSFLKGCTLSSAGFYSVNASTRVRYEEAFLQLIYHFT